MLINVCKVSLDDSWWIMLKFAKFRIWNWVEMDGNEILIGGNDQEMWCDDSLWRNHGLKSNLQ